MEKFNQTIEESLEEVGKELQLISKISLDGFNLNSHDSFDDKKLFKFGGSLIALAGAALFFVAPPIGIVLGIFGAGLNLISNWFTSKAEKRRKAVEKISNSLHEQINKQKDSVIESAIKNFEQYSRDVLISINSYFYELTEGLDELSNQLEKAQNSLDATVNYLNYGYAKRIIDWTLERYEPLTVENTKKAITKVTRQFGQSITIRTKTEIEIKKSLEEMKQILQEDIAIDTLTRY